MRSLQGINVSLCSTQRHVCVAGLSSSSGHDTERPAGSGNPTAAADQRPAAAAGFQGTASDLPSLTHQGHLLLLRSANTHSTCSGQTSITLWLLLPLSHDVGPVFDLLSPVQHPDSL